MSPSTRAKLSLNRTLVVTTLLQAVCAVFFVIDALIEFTDRDGSRWHQLPEVAAVLVLSIGTALGARKIWQLIGQNQRMESRLRVASGAFIELLEESFAQWGLTPSEREVALLSIKGLSISEIAALRETRSGTVKAQCAAVYRKAGVSGRSQLLAHFVEDLMAGTVLDAPAPLTRRSGDVALQQARH
jgi:DNA-binding CsgD family transcriptional regulator